MHNLKTNVLRGGFARGCSQATTLVLRVTSLTILARLLEPHDFGLVGMVTAATGIFNLFKDAGLSVVTIQRPEITEAELTALFWVNILVGVVLAFLCVAMAPALVAFYHEPRLLWISVALGAGFLINAAGVQHSALLQRRMRFVTLAGIEILSWVVSIVVGVGLAFGGFGYWSLVWMAISLPMVATAGAWLTIRWAPGIPRWSQGIASMLRVGGTVTVNTIIIYVAYNTDKLLIGRWWGAEALGIYGRACQLLSIPTENLNGAVGGIAISALSRLHEDPPRFRRYFLKSYSLVLAFTLPITMAFGLLSDEIIAVLLGPKWGPAAPLIRVMSPTIVALALLNPLGWMLIADGRVVRSLTMAFIIAPTVVVGYVSGVPFGPAGIAFGYSAAMLILCAPMIALATKGTVISFPDVLRTVLPPLVSAVVATVLAFAVLSAVATHLSALARLALGGSAVVGPYLAMLLCFPSQRALYRDLLSESRLALLSWYATPLRPQSNAVL